MRVSVILKSNDLAFDWPARRNSTCLTSVYLWRAKGGGGRRGRSERESERERAREKERDHEHGV
jgi:hypothetical protein